MRFEKGGEQVPGFVRREEVTGEGGCGRNSEENHTNRN